jgi:hypothetical protein
MAIAISSQMSQSLIALMGINQDMNTAKNKINTGKSINDPSDNIAVYFKARGFAEKAEAFDSVNANISQANANLDFVDKAISNMLDNVKGARQILSDAKAKPVAVTAPVSLTGRQAYATTTVTVGNSTRSIKGQVVDPASGSGAGANNADGSYFQAGDVFRVELRDSVSNTTVTRYLAAVAPDAASAPDQTKSGSSAANAIEFNDLASLANALNLGLGRGNAAFDAVSSNGKYSLSMALASNTMSITFGQVVDAPNSSGNSGDSVDFSRILQNSRAAGVAVSVDNSLDPSRAPSASSYTFSPLAVVTTDQGAIDGRKQAADFFRQTMYGLDTTVKDASLPGYANILKGEAMTVALNDTNSVQQTVKFATGVDLSASRAGGSTYGVGLQVNGGVVSTDFTDTGTAMNDNFMSETSLADAISKLDQISTALGQQRKLMAAAKTAMASRLDLNKTLASTLMNSANEMTAVDVTKESINIASLQDRQSFATASLAITRQSEQQMLALLR